MTVIKCVECRSEVSTTAAACPHCGAVAFAPSPKPAEAATADTEQYATAAKVLLGLIMLVVVALPVKCAIDAPKRRTAAEAREAKREAADARFQWWRTKGVGGDAIAALRREPRVLDATWSAQESLWITVRDDGTRRDGYAMAMCETIRAAGWRGEAAIHIYDHGSMLAGKFRKLGDYRCVH